LGAFFFGCAEKKPGFPLQLLALPRCGVSAAIPGAPTGRAGGLEEFGRTEYYIIDRQVNGCL
jgi:hypothetical protein